MHLFQLHPAFLCHFEVDVTYGHILFVGEDICARLEVLEHTGYRVARCPCETDAIRDALAGNRFDAVIFQCTPEPPSPLLLSTCRTLSSAPFVLFADRNSPFHVRDFEAVVPNLCNPREWLSDLKAVIATYHHPSLGKAPRSESPIRKGQEEQMR